jgi:hypothetical protein
MEWMFNIMWHVFNFIYIQAKDVKLLQWLTNNNNYDMM